MGLTRRDVARGLALSALPVGRRAFARAPSVRIGVLTNMTGPYRDQSGPTFVACIRQAVEEASAAAPGMNVEVLVADPQGKPDVGVSIVREWLDRDGVDMVNDASNSAIALAVNTVVRDKSKVYINSGGTTPSLTAAQCSPSTIKWTYDSTMLAKSTGAATVRAGGDSWFFITVDYTFGHSLQRDTARFVTEAGGRVVGAAAYPFPETTDFSPFLLQAKASDAKVIALANTGDDTVNCIKQAREFGLGPPGHIVAALFGNLTVVSGLGLEAAQGLLLTESFYWDMNARTRAFTARVLPKTPSNYPNMAQAGGYASTLHYLKTVASMGIDLAKQDGVATVNAMKAMPYDDDAFGRGIIRKDGRVLVPAYLFRVKAPAESEKPWDFYHHLSTMPGDEAAAPLAEEHCAFAPS